MGSGKVKTMRFVLVEAARAFMRDQGFTLASSLSFYSTIALIPALFLLTYLNTVSEGLSELLNLKASDIVREFIPAYSSDLRNEILKLIRPTNTLGVINVFVLLWSISPLIRSIRSAFRRIFKFPEQKRVLAFKLLDIIVITLFVMGFSAIGAWGVLFRLLPQQFMPGALQATILPFTSMFILVFLFYLIFSPRTKRRYLLVGTLVATLLWFMMRPGFNLFLTYNAGFGLAFGSLKSVFVVVIWIYISQCVFLYGAEVAAGLKRAETIFIKKLIDGKAVALPEQYNTLVIEYAADEIIFKEGDSGDYMYYILNGHVGIRKDGKEIAVVNDHRYFGEISFLLSQDRSATAYALSDLELVKISNDNFDILVLEYPDIVREMLSEMAQRLHHTTEMLTG